ncbi:MAG: tRNA (uracil-5-)-methyltransferase [Actinomycetota bacterium]|jgi:ubiquinone/menaquinone biosynthesis C-methylase UbiE|nr:tRNA (uracil-5-)-methyltransferase [Actinomycetota bacterium]
MGALSDESLLALLCCPRDRSDLGAVRQGNVTALECPACGASYPVRDGIVSFLTPEQLSEQELREQSSRDQESVWYDSMFEGYTNAVEVPTVLARIGRPNGPILDHGAGTGRITSALVELGQPVIAVDYSAVSLRTLVERCAGKGTGTVLAVQADVRHLPVRDGVVAAATSVEIYEHVRGGDERRRVLEELARVLSPGGVLAISTFNFNLVYRLWQLKGNVGAREGEHLLGGDFYYYRFSHKEFRDELEAVFDVDHLAGIRNIPARSLGGAVRKVGAHGLADRFLDYMVKRGHRLDWALERTPLSRPLGFFWLARAVRKPA